MHGSVTVIYHYHGDVCSQDLIRLLFGENGRLGIIYVCICICVCVCVVGYFGEDVGLLPFAKNTFFSFSSLDSEMRFNISNSIFMQPQWQRQPSDT